MPIKTEKIKSIINYYSASNINNNAPEKANIFGDNTRQNI